MDLWQTTKNIISRATSSNDDEEKKRGLKSLMDTDPYIKAKRMVEDIEFENFTNNFKSSLNEGLQKIRAEANKPRDFSPTFKQSLGETEALTGRFLKGATLGAVDPYKKSKTTDFMFGRPLSQSPSKGTAAKIAGWVAEEAPSLAYAKGLSPLVKPAFKPLQQTLGKKASKLIAQEGGKKLLGKGVAAASSEIPFNLSYIGLQKARGKDYSPKEAAGDFAWDAAVGALPLGIGALSQASKGDIGDLPINKKAASRKLENLWNYTDRLVKEKGFTPQQADKIGFKKGMKILGENTPEKKIHEALQQADVKKKVNLLDYFWTPEQVFKRVGLGDNAKQIRSAHENYLDDLTEEISKIKNWDNKLDEISSEIGTPKREVNKRIFNFLDGNLNKKDLSPPEQKLAAEVSNWFEGWARKLGLKPNERITNYVTHIFERGNIEQEFDQELAKLIKDKVPGSVYNPFKQVREGKVGYIEDFIRATEAYAKRATREYRMTPALKSLQNAAQKLDNETYDYVQKVAADINLRPNSVDNLIDNMIKSSPVGYKYGTRPISVISRKFRQAVYRGALGLNFNSALKNLSQGANTYAELGEKYTTLGYADLIDKGLKGNLDELYENKILIDKFIEEVKPSAYKKPIQKLDPILFSLFDLTEKINRGSAYFGAKRKYIAEGLSEKQAIQKAKELVRKTQFTFGPMDTPVVLRGDAAKLVGQFGSFTLKQAEFLKNLAKDKNFKGLIRFIASTIVFYKTIGRLLSYKPGVVDSLLPTFSPLDAPAPKLGLGALEYIHGKATGDPREAGLGKWKVKSTLPTLVPAGVQLKRTGEWLFEGGPEGLFNKRGGQEGWVDLNPVSETTWQDVDSKEIHWKDIN